MQVLDDALAWLRLFCLWTTPQPASNPNLTQTQKSSRQPSPQEDDEYRGSLPSSNTRKSGITERKASDPQKN